MELISCADESDVEQERRGKNNARMLAQTSARRDFLFAELGKAVVGTWSIAGAWELPREAIQRASLQSQSSGESPRPGWAWTREAWGLHADGLPVRAFLGPRPSQGSQRSGILNIAGLQPEGLLVGEAGL